MKLSKNAKIGIIAAISIIILFFVFRQFIARKRVEMSGELDKKPNEMNRTKTLKKGVTGAEVAELQRYLIRDGYGVFLGNTGPAKNGVDGVFGPKTEAALMQAKGVTTVTLLTYATLSKPGTPKQTTSTTASAGGGLGSGVNPVNTNNGSVNSIGFESPIIGS